MDDNYRKLPRKNNSTSSFKNGVHCSPLAFFDDDDDDDDDRDFIETSVFSEPRHTEAIEGLNQELPDQSWRTKIKTTSVALVLCLNVGTDPPDAPKPDEAAFLQCWIDPFSLKPETASKTVAIRLAEQYKPWQPQTRIKACVDPTVEDISKLCSRLRKQMAQEGEGRVLFHYNGHGVPRPTAEGELWAFNSSFTQYVPFNFVDLLRWMGGTPSVYVFDCSNAGTIVEQAAAQCSSGAANLFLGACSRGESLPFPPDLPADLFTSCLTTPVRTFLVWFTRRKERKLAPTTAAITADQLIEHWICTSSPPADHRQSVFRELSGILNAVTDAIAWDTLPAELFQRLFRQDQLVAGLYRNFLLAQRIMAAYNCTAVSSPAIPAEKTVHHPLWKSLDLAVDGCLVQLAAKEQASKGVTTLPPSTPYVPSQFFADQLTAFEVWLRLRKPSDLSPPQLPIILQVLLNRTNRLRGFKLLADFLSLGPWAVNLALSSGIFDYVLKLLRLADTEVKPFLLLIWAKILAIDASCQVELVRENAHTYFMEILADSYISPGHQIRAAFVLSAIVRRHPLAQNLMLLPKRKNGKSFIDIALSLLLEQHQEKDHPDLRKWLLICLGNVWENKAEVRKKKVKEGNCSLAEQLFPFLEDPVPEVRAAAVYALGTFVNSNSNSNTMVPKEHLDEVDCIVASALLKELFYDSSPLVRRELLVALHGLIRRYENLFISSLKRSYEEFGELRYYQHRESASVPVADEALELITHVFGQKALNEDQADSPAISSSFPTSANNDNDDNIITKPFLNYHRRLMLRAMMKSRAINHSTTLAEAVEVSKTVTERLWQMVELTVLDPEPEVARLADLIYDDLLAKANISKEGGNSSEPHSQAPQAPRKLLLSTGFIDWCTKHILQPCSHHHRGIGCWDCASSLSNRITTSKKEDLAVEWRSAMLRRYYRKKRASLEEGPHRSSSSSSSTNNVNPQVIVGKRNADARILALHPFEKFLVYASGDSSSFSVWNYDLQKKQQHSGRLYQQHLNSTVTTYCNDTNAYVIENDSVGGDGGARITDLKLINTADRALVMVAAEDSSVKVWADLLPTAFSGRWSPVAKNDDINGEGGTPPTPRLATAFFIFEDAPLGPGAGAGAPCSSSAGVYQRGAHRPRRLRLWWEQCQQRLVAGGEHPFVRLWDAHREAKIGDIWLGGDGMEAVTSLSSDYRHLICVGGEDGSVRLFDDRQQGHAAQIYSAGGGNWNRGPVMNAMIWPSEPCSAVNSIHLVSGHRSGEVCWYDRRSLSKAVEIERNEGPMTAMDFHENTDVFACSFGTDSSEMQLYTSDALRGPLLKNQNRHVKCLSFHPLKSKFALALNDGTLAIYKTTLRLAQNNF